MQRMDRSQLARDLAKAAAYADCGDPVRATENVACLLAAFREAGVNVEYAFRLSESLGSPSLASDWIAER